MTRTSVTPLDVDTNEIAPFIVTAVKVGDGMMTTEDLIGATAARFQVLTFTRRNGGIFFYSTWPPQHCRWLRLRSFSCIL
jgi:hypothetical protein